MTAICLPILRLAAVAGLVLAMPSIAAANCGPHEDMVKVLASKFFEAPHAIGTVNEDKLVELFVSKGGTWTILVTTPTGSSCIIAAGQNWEVVPVSLRSLDPAA